VKISSCWFYELINVKLKNSDFYRRNDQLKKKKIGGNEEGRDVNGRGRPSWGIGRIMEAGLGVENGRQKIPKEMQIKLQGIRDFMRLEG
jgi:hypothetical protein